MTDVAHTERAHALYSPSGAYRWMACPGSINLTRDLPDTSSVFAREGTAAHELGEHCLKHGYEAKRFLGSVIDIADENTRFFPNVKEDRENRFEVNKNMVEAVQTYLDHASDILAQEGVGSDDFIVEKRFDLQFIAPGMFGTGDLVIANPDLKVLHVIDYKHGMGVAVDPEENPQLIAYALGAARHFSNYGFYEIRLTVVQPRAFHARGPIRTWSTDRQTLEGFAVKMRDAAKLAEDPDAALVPGKHCDFCKAARSCPALRAEALAVAQEDFENMEASEPTQDEVAEWLTKVEAVEIWAKRVREFANAEGKSGRVPTGFKFVSKRASRKWSDEGKALSALRVALEAEDDDILTPRVLMSPPKVEKAIGKKNFALVRSLVVSKSSGVVLAPESDPRPAVAVNAEDEFEDMSEEGGDE